MSILWVYIVIHAACATDMLAAINTTAIGQGFFLASRDLFGEFALGATIFESLPTSCYEVVKKPETKQVSTFFSTSSTFYEYVTNKVGLTASMKGKYTMGTTLSITSESISGQSLLTSGMSLDIYALKDYTVLSQDCINSQPLVKTFLDDFQALPVQIQDPNNANDWLPYDSFLKRYGSHFVKEINHGSRLQQWVFAQQSKMYTERDFNVRGCVDLNDDTGSLKVNLCGNYTTKEKEEVLKFSMSNQLQIKGGTAETRAKLRKARSAELIQNFLVEAQSSPGNVLYTWFSVWDLLKQRYFGTTGDNLARAMNLEAYYEGRLDFGCTKVVTNGVVLRWLEKGGTAQQPEYSCFIAQEGCRDGNRDCHLGGSGSSCYCYGPTCVDSEPVTDPNSKIKVQRVMRTNKKGSYKSGINNSCYYRFLAHCNCNHNWGGSPTKIWPTDAEYDSRRLLWNLHNKAKKQQSSSNRTSSGYKGNTYYLYALMCLAMFLLMN